MKMRSLPSQVNGFTSNRRMHGIVCKKLEKYKQTYNCLHICSLMYLLLCKIKLLTDNLWMRSRQHRQTTHGDCRVARQGNVRSGQFMISFNLVSRCDDVTLWRSGITVKRSDTINNKFTRFIVYQISATNTQLSTHFRGMVGRHKQIKMFIANV